ncbi:hypothetical protein N3K66_006581 [Trichothecium roseum]|uniref:Uncharacterized protein n=1 Tax=Trichothecium roseum TaxID=47278 RepID=A0ACC0UVS0_9HYPO|nr:hypothetical protein N3K66_006581 [Trichothecium roseum]
MASRIPLRPAHVRIAPRLLPSSSSSSSSSSSHNLPTSARRLYSSKQPGPTSHFYKTFTRPIAKTLLIAVFTYQFAYWAWSKLETDEIRAEADATIRDLEGKVEDYKKKVIAEGAKGSKEKA